MGNAAHPRVLPQLQCNNAALPSPNPHLHPQVDKSKLVVPTPKLPQLQAPDLKVEIPRLEFKAPPALEVGGTGGRRGWRGWVGDLGHV